MAEERQTAHATEAARPASGWLGPERASVSSTGLDSYPNNDMKANAQGVGRVREKAQLADNVRGYLRATQQLRPVVMGYFQAKHVRYAA